MGDASRLDQSNYIEIIIKQTETKNNMQKESELKLYVIIKTGIFLKINYGIVRIRFVNCGKEVLKYCLYKRRKPQQSTKI